MSFSQRAKSVAEIGQRVLEGGEAGYEIKDFLHEFKEAGSVASLEQRPPTLTGKVVNGAMLDAFLQALAVHLSPRIDSDPPEWTRDIVRSPDPWFASPGMAIRNYLLISSPAPFRTRNLFVDPDSLEVV